MKLCWQFYPKHRPTFLEVIERLLPDLDSSFKDVSYFFSEENRKDLAAADAASSAAATAAAAVVEVGDTENQTLISNTDKTCANDHSRKRLNSSSLVEDEEAEMDSLSFTGDVDIEELDNGTLDHDDDDVDVVQRAGSRSSMGAASSASRSVDSVNISCECIQTVQNEVKKRRSSSANSQLSAAAAAAANHLPPVCSSNEGSKGSSKSSGSGYAHLNGLANGHVHLYEARTTEC